MLDSQRGLRRRSKPYCRLKNVLRILHGLTALIIGADLVEFNPTRDIFDMTAMVAAKFYKEIVGRMLAA